MDAAAVAVAAVTDPLSAGRTIEVVARPRKLCDPPFEEHLQVLFTGLRPDTEVYPPPEEGPSFLSRCSRCLNCVGMGAAAEEDAPLFGPASATAGT